MKATNARTPIDGYDQDDAVLGEHATRKPTWRATSIVGSRGLADRF